MVTGTVGKHEFIGAEVKNGSAVKTAGGTSPLSKALLDTDIYSEVLKAINPTVAQNAAAYRRTHGVLTISVITIELAAWLGLWRADSVPNLTRRIEKRLKASPERSNDLAEILERPTTTGPHAQSAQRGEAGEDER